jgi:hypothetical protein
MIDYTHREHASNSFGGTSPMCRDVVGRADVRGEDNRGTRKRRKIVQVGELAAREKMRHSVIEALLISTHRWRAIQSRDPRPSNCAVAHF